MLPISSHRFYATADRIPAFPGAYLLLVEFREGTVVRLRDKPKAYLTPGLYIYRLCEWARRTQRQSFQIHASRHEAPLAY